MRHKKIFVISAALLMAMRINAQAPNDLPVVVPPSPELASLAKIGSLSAGLHTGAANVNIPLYEVTAGSIKLPVALSYSTNGIRVNDIASRVGLGWNLVAGGVITRTVHDEADGADGITWLAPPASFTATTGNTDLVNYLKYANLDNYDTERDEYSYSINGLSGKFFIDGAGFPRQMNHSNVTIERSGGGFLLTDVQGTKYYFGGGTGKDYEEWTHGQSTNGNNRWAKFVQTGWFIRRIETPENDWIAFTYNGFGAPIQTIQGPSQSMTLSPLMNTYDNVCTNGNPCRGSWKAPTMNEVHYDTRYLSLITSSNGVQVYFLYEGRPDLSHDNRLTSVWAQQAIQGTAKIINKYHLEYQDMLTGETNIRFYLKKLYTYSSTLTGTPPAPEETLLHQFDYNDQSLPLQTSYSQDYFGYYNGKSNAGFAPKLSNWAVYENGELGADRTPDFNSMVKGSLTKVTYPTGGYEEFTYEQHTRAEQAYDSTFSSFLIAGNGILNNITTPTVVTRLFTTGANPFVRISLTCSTNPGYTTYVPDGGRYLVDLKIYKTSESNAGGPNYKFYTNGTYNTSYIGLEANTQYTVVMNVYNRPTHGELQVFYNPVLTPKWDNKVGCGMRVANIRSYDPVTNKQTIKYYKYTSIEDITKSSGVGMLATDCVGSYPGGGMCVGPSNFSTQIQCDNLIQVSSSSITGSYTFGGSSIAYATVIETDDPAYVNGGIQHSFYTIYNSNRPTALVGSMMPTSPFNIGNDFNGIETLTTYFKKSPTSFVTLKKTENIYGVDNRVSFTVKSHVNRRKWADDVGTGAPIAEQIMPFDAGEYSYTSNWYHLNSTVTTDYDQDGMNPMVQTVSYDYNNTNHTLPNKTTTVNSAGETITNEMKYPVDYAIAPYTNMVTRHILSPVVESKSLNNAVLTTTVKTDYADWGLTGTVFRPSLVKMAKGAATQETRLHYYEMNAAGRPLQVAKEDGMPIAYIWDYRNTYPVAEVKNAAVGDIAYTSFEMDDNRGNWTVLGTLQPGGSTDFNLYWKTFPGESITGKTAFGGKLTRSVNIAKNYTVTLWSKTGSNTPTVNSLPGTLLFTKNNWGFYSWSITAVSSVTVQGNKIDEVRLYPSSALMTTYTYEPYVGVSTIADAIGNILYYEYDGLNRLLLVRNTENQILKQYEYKYNQAIAPCPNLASWVATGATRCEVNPANNQFSGIKQAQERDENNCSPTYLGTRWTAITTPPGECANLPGCSGISKRPINGVCVTGTKVLVSSYKSGATWYCTYKYVWSIDGYESPTVTETGTLGCEVSAED